MHHQKKIRNAIQIMEARYPYRDDMDVVQVNQLKRRLITIAGVLLNSNSRTQYDKALSMLAAVDGHPSVRPAGERYLEAGGGLRDQSDDPVNAAAASVPPAPEPSSLSNVVTPATGPSAMTWGHRFDRPSTLSTTRSSEIIYSRCPCM